MIKHLQFLSVFFVAVVLTACAVNAENPESYRSFVNMSGINELGYEKPQVIDETTAIRTSCATGGSKSVQNYNAFAKYMKQNHQNDFSILGENRFISYAWCHKDLKNPDQFVVGLVTISKRQWQQDRKQHVKTYGPTIYTFFDKDMNVIKWGMSGIEVVSDAP